MNKYRNSKFLYSEYIKLIIKISTPKIITLKHMIFDKLLKKLIKIEREPTNIKPNIKFKVLQLLIKKLSLEKNCEIISP